MYDAAQLAADLENAISQLSTIVRRVEVTQGFNEVLSEAQLDEVYCCALILSASVTEYLADAISYLEGNLGIFKCL